MRLLIAAFLLAAAPASAGYPSGQPLGNWAGYQQTAGNYTSVQVEFQVPAVTFGLFPAQTAALSQWVGIGDESPAGQVQTGVNESILDTGETHYNAFWATGNGSGDAFDDTVTPGDLIIATVACTANCTPGAAQTWSMTVQDVTRGWTDSKEETDTRNLGEADFISEVPTQSLPSTLYPMAGYDTIGFQHALVATSGGVLATPNFQITDERYQKHLGQTSNPSDPNATNDGFNICMGTASKYTDCPAAPTFSDQNVPATDPQ